jgi:hypothetical protein
MGMGMGSGGPGGPGMGPRARAKDDKDTTPERVRSALQGDGEINEVKTFKGLPKEEEGEARITLQRLTRAAAQEAEEALSDEEIPRRRRDAVRKYFEELQPK